MKGMKPEETEEKEEVNKERNERKRGRVKEGERKNILSTGSKNEKMFYVFTVYHNLPFYTRTQHTLMHDDGVSTAIAT